MLDGETDSDEEPTTLRHYRFTLHDDDDADNYVYDPMGEETIPEEVTAPPPLTEIFADVDRQLAHHPADTRTASPTNPEEVSNLARMDLHVRNILAGAGSQLFVLNLATNSALRHHLPPPTLPPLTEASINDEIASMYAAYYGGSSDDDEDKSETEVHWATQPPHCRNVRHTTHHEPHRQGHAS